MADLEDVRQAVIESIIQTMPEADPRNVTESASLVDDLGCDSLDIVEIVMEVEEKLDIEISDKIGDKIGTVGELIAAAARLAA